MLERIRSARGGLALGGLALAAVVAFAVVPIVSAASPSPSSAPAGPSSSPATGTARGQAGAATRNPLLAGTVRAEATVVRRDGSTVLIHYERGQVTAITPTSITIQGRDGKGATFVVDAQTKVRAKGEAIPYSDLKVGDRAMVFGLDQGGAYTAVLIRCVQPAAGS